jgi:glycosyltransferase involved in cell wall biosynthesis
LIRTAIIFVNYGPYHVARVEGLAKVEDIEPRFIELASEHKKYPWQGGADKSGVVSETLSNAPYERNSFRELYGKLSRALDDFGPQAVVIPSYSPPIMLAAARWAKRYGAVSIMMNETTALDHPRVWWKEAMKSFLVKRYYDAAFVGGVATREYISGLGMSDEWIWERYDVVDNDYFSTRAGEISGKEQEYRKEYGLPDRYFLYAGRFSEEKNLPRLLEAYRRYRDRRPDGWSLVMVGDGPQREELFETSRRLGLEDVVWPGFKPVDELPVYYALGNAFILPSTSEPWGLVVNEAMASSLPVLVSNRCGSAPDLVSEGGNGYTFDPYDVEELEDRMLALSESGEIKRYSMSETSRKIITDYTPEIWVENLTDCIRQTMSRKKAKDRSSR